MVCLVDLLFYFLFINVFTNIFKVVLNEMFTPTRPNMQMSAVHILVSWMIESTLCDQTRGVCTVTDKSNFMN